MKRSGTLFGLQIAVLFLLMGTLGWFSVVVAQPGMSREEILKRASGFGQTEPSATPEAPSFSPPPELEDTLRPKELKEEKQTRRPTTAAYLGAIVMASDQATTREIVQPRKSDLPGTILDINTPIDAELYLPSGWKVSGNAVDLLVHIHGTPWMVEQNFEAAGLNAVLLTINPGGRGSQYAETFSNPEVFEFLLDLSLQRLKRENKVAADAEWGKIAVSSFSSGYGAVREILYTALYFNQVDALALADGLHTRFADEATSKSREVDPDQMRPFVEFAKLAVKGDKTMVISRSSILPLYYTGTPETAVYLVQEIGGKEVAIDPPTTDANGRKLIAKYDQGNFHMTGYAGIGAADHMEHLFNIQNLFVQLPFSKK